MDLLYEGGIEWVSDKYAFLDYPHYRSVCGKQIYYVASGGDILNSVGWALERKHEIITADQFLKNPEIISGWKRRYIAGDKVYLNDYSYCQDLNGNHFEHPRHLPKGKFRFIGYGSFPTARYTSSHPEKIKTNDAAIIRDDGVVIFTNSCYLSML